MGPNHTSLHDWDPLLLHSVELLLEVGVHSLSRVLRRLPLSLNGIDSVNVLSDLPNILHLLLANDVVVRDYFDQPVVLLYSLR